MPASSVQDPENAVAFLARPVTPPDKAGPPIKLVEQIDLLALRVALSNIGELEEKFVGGKSKADRKSAIARAKNYYDIAKKHASADKTAASVPITYHQMHGFGRYVAAHSCGLQGLSKQFRHTICKARHDVDVVNAFPTFLIQWCKLRGVSCRHLEYYVANRPSILELSAKEGLVAKAEDAKTVYLAVISGARRKEVQCPFYIGFYAELQKIQNEIARLNPELHTYVKTVPPRPGAIARAEGRTTAYFLQSIENEVTMVLRRVLEPRFPEVLAFDGLQTLDDPTDMLRECEKAVCAELDLEIELKIKPMDLAVDLSGFADGVPPEDVDALIDVSIWAGNDKGVADVIHAVLGDRFMCTDPTHNVWYEFRQHAWEKDEGATMFKRAIMDEIVPKYKSFLDGLVARQRLEDDEKIKTHVDGCRVIVRGLGRTGYLRNVVSMCQLVQYDGEFEKLRDENKTLFGCTNGVLDFSGEEPLFRDGRPEDRLTMSCGFDYEEDADTTAVLEHFEKLFPNQNIRNYFLDLSSSCLEGGNPYKRFAVNTGETDAGKSRAIELLRKVFGAYAINFPRAMIIKGRGTSSSAPRPELARSRGCRIVTLDEIGTQETVDIGVLKNLTGNDDFYARTLHDKGGDIKPQFTMFMQCNTPPDIPDNDEATWNRTRVIEFESRYSTHAPEDEKDQILAKHFPVDPKISETLDRLKVPLLTALVQRFAACKRDSLHEPAEVLASTSKYRKRCDPCQQFFDDCFEVCADAVTLNPDTSDALHGWKFDNGVASKQISKRRFLGWLKERFEPYKNNHQRGFKGFKLVPSGKGAPVGKMLRGQK